MYLKVNHIFVINDLGIGSSNGISVVQHHQGDYNTDIGNNNNINKASHPSQLSLNNTKTTTLNNNQKKMLDTQDHQQSRSNILFEDHSKKLGYMPKPNQNGLLNNGNGVVGGNKKSETHSYPNSNKMNHRVLSQGSKMSSNLSYFYSGIFCEQIKIIKMCFDF